MKNIISILTLLSILSCSNYNYSLKKSERLKDSLSFFLCETYGLDQGIRNLPLKGKNFSIQSIDTINFLKIVKYVNENGFPTEKSLGSNNYNHECVQGCVFSILLHNPHFLINEDKYFNLFLNQVKLGNLKPEGFATILDKYYWAKSINKSNRKVFYGSQFGKPCIQTKDETNKARKEIGLKLLEDKDFVECEKEELTVLKGRIKK